MHDDLLCKLLGPCSIQKFCELYFRKAPLFVCGSAAEYRKQFRWDTISEIIGNGHNDCWLADKGKLGFQSPDKIDNFGTTGKITVEQAMIGYVSGKTVLIRKAEKSHDAFAKIAQYFRTIFAAAVDIQLYATPSLCEGFDWHYDLEDVFVIQSSGEKVFNLRGNKADLDTLKAKPVEIPKTTDLLEQQMDTTELKFHLRAGDLLYIPAGYWHKARSIRDSFHISIGILNGTIPTPPASLCSI